MENTTHANPNSSVRARARVIIASYRRPVGGDLCVTPCCAILVASGSSLNTKGVCVMAVTGKTGADAFFKAVNRQRITVNAYRAKLLAVISVMQGLSLLTASEAAQAIAMVEAIAAAYDVWIKIADYSGF